MWQLRPEDRVFQMDLDGQTERDTFFEIQVFGVQFDVGPTSARAGR